MRLLVKTAIVTASVGLLWAGRKLAAFRFEEPAAQQDVPQPAAQKTSKKTTLQKDDLTQIKGIGPKGAALLDKAGVTSFKDLAAMKPSELKELLKSRGMAFADPSTWPDQARKLKKS